MKKKVAYVDHEGFRQFGELQEFEIDRFFTEDKPDSKGRFGYGFALRDGQPRGTRGIFFSARREFPWMRAYGTTKLEYIPQFSDAPDSLDERGPANEPKQRVRIVGVVGEGRQGIEIVAWSYPSSYERALKSCAAFVELERERIERDPRFHLLETITRSCEKESKPTRIFIGSKDQVEHKYPLGSYVESAARFDPTTSRNVGDTLYRRWWEQETETDEWKPCDDPRKMRFQLTRNAAAKLLRECTRKLDANGWPIWYRRDSNKIVAIGSTPKSDQKLVSFHDTPNYLRTEFTGKTEDFWKIGSPDEFEDPTPNTIPDANQYAPSQLAERRR